jgi:pimeloyl-ACP methyl ester carboxylesterase
MARRGGKKAKTRTGGAAPAAAGAAAPVQAALAASAPFQLRGSVAGAGSAPTLPLSLFEPTVSAEFRPGAARTATGEQTVTVRPEDILEIELEDGQHLWMSALEYRERYASGVSRDATGADVVLASNHLQVLPQGLQTRGPVAWVVKSLKVIGIDLSKQSALSIAKRVDTRTAPGKRPALGLHRCRLETGRFALADAGGQKLGAQRPQLVFLHGTASSTWTSFGDLWSADRAAELAALRKHYEDAVFAFEHASMSVSPVRNALDLLGELAPGARVHLVSHSRGGLIGELLCRGARTQGDPFGSREILAYRKSLQARAEEIGEALDVDACVAELEELNRRLAQKRPVVERFVRVACPTLGTTLASRRLDRWLNVVGNVCGMALPNTPRTHWFSDLGDFMAAVVAKRTDPATLPGLEAMMPDSGLIRVLNWPTAEVDGDLAVIAGDIDPDAWWARLLVWATDKFYQGDHDLVVNTASMLGGTRRAGDALVSRHKGTSVHHFNYFANQPSAAAVVRGLTRTAEDTEGFEPLARPTGEIARAAIVKPSLVPRPIVFVLPGIMGSELFVGRDRIWLDIPGLMFGGLKQLAIDAKNVTALQPIPSYYGALVNYMESSHKAIQFAFDWRLPVEDSADRLAERVRAELDIATKAGKPVRLLAHSMGGLVARSMIARHPDLWQEMCKHPGARLVMLGTPNGGSHAVTEMLVGQSSTLNELATLDLTQSKRELLEIVSRYPGLLAMLPNDPRKNYFSAQTWQTYHAAAGEGWVPPSAEDLDRAQRCRDRLDQAPIDPQRMLYVAGSADVTVAAMELDAARREIRFLATARGDGRVTWDSGIPAGVPTWYMDVEHGDLCAFEPAFPALKDLLETGTTNRLPQTPRVARGAEEVFPMPREVLELAPTEDVLAASVVGAGSRKRKARPRAKVQPQVQVVHGNLAYVKHPIAVGHYANDAIVSAEKYLDDALGGELGQRHRLGLYPGPLGTSAIFVNRAARGVGHPGAIVVGLGTPGQLSAGALTRTFLHALLEYVLEVDRDPTGVAAVDDASGLKTVGLSSLLIGTGAGGINVGDCVYALLSGLDLANEALEHANQRLRIGRFDLIELWEDRALQAVEALQALADRPDLKDKFAWRPALAKADGGLRRIRYEEPAGWWHRLQILGGGKLGESGDGTLRFVASTRRARSEVRLQRTQRALVDSFIERAIRQTTDDEAVAGTLFELLLPNELKEQAPDRGDVVLLLDEEAARYPWELLRDPSRPQAAPLAVEQGSLRQLESHEFRETVRPVLDNSALVIGDPESSFPELPGAQKEAEAVWQVLRSRGQFQVEKRIRPRAQELMIALYARPYRVLHLAGHGVYRYLRAGAAQCGECGQPLPAEQPDQRGQDGERITGMVIGDDAFLTPVEVRQMRQVPELVFINCCHLGRIEGAPAGDAASRNERTDYNRIAANVATEFIRMGVRAVVAAGWAVDDDAAALFGRTFYDRMLSGVPFGKAVLAARKAVYERFPRSNTWGAYQCYGDPDWKLTREAGDIPEDRPAERYASPSQAATDLENLAAQLKTGALQPERGRDKLAALVKRLEAEGLVADPQVLAPLGRAYGEAQMFSEAVRSLSAALATECARVSVSDIELLANLEARDAVRVALAGEPTAAVAQRTALAEVDTAIRRLDALNATAGAQLQAGEPGTAESATVERLALLGSAYKRKAWISARERPAALARSRDYYRQAYARRKDPYPFLNLLSAEIVSSWHQRGAAPADLAGLIGDELTNQRASLREALSRDRGFWTSAMLADLDLLQALGEQTLDDNTLDGVATGYRLAAERGSPRELASVLEQIDFIAAMARDAMPAADRWLQQLRDRVTGADQRPAAARARKRASTSPVRLPMRASAAGGRRKGKNANAR